MVFLYKAMEGGREYEAECISQDCNVRWGGGLLCPSPNSVSPCLLCSAVCAVYHTFRVISRLSHSSSHYHNCYNNLLNHYRRRPQFNPPRNRPSFNPIGVEQL